MSELIARTMSVLATGGARWRALAAITPELLERPPAAGEWSALDCLGHLVATEHAVFRARVGAILAGRDFAAWDPDAAGAIATAATPADLAERFAGLRGESLTTLAGLVEADLERTARHAELGVVTLRELLNEWAAHDTMHTVQAERALMQPFIAGSGPWRPYFADHDVAGGASTP